jgi:hypothetical protein
MRFTGLCVALFAGITGLTVFSDDGRAMVDRMDDTVLKEFRVLPSAAHAKRPITLAESVLQRSVVVRRRSQAQAPDMVGVWLASVVAALGLLAIGGFVFARRSQRPLATSQGRSVILPIQSADGSPSPGFEKMMFGAPRSRG